MSIDKKAVQGIPKFVVLRRIGQADVQQVAPELVAQAIRAHTVAASA
jgi:3-dehydroquinate synthetase